MSQNPERTQFGEQTVTPEEKTGLVRGVFDSVAERYDLMNDLMSGGMHRLWKDSLIRQIKPRHGLKYLDVAGGTGDIAFRIQNTLGGKGDITICDLTHDMLAVGRNRAIDRAWPDAFDWVNGNAESLPLPDNSYDVYTIAFGLRNVTHIDTALAEACRVLKPGGRFYCLEFSHVPNPFLSKAYDMYSYNIIPRLGQKITQDRESYQYLVESIRRFPTQSNLKRRMERAGFTRNTYRNMTGGVVAIHSGLKA